MNYYTIRMIIFIIILLICCVKFKNAKKSLITQKRIIILLILVSYLIFLIPIETLFLKFKNPENYYHYFNPTGKIIKEYDYEDYSYILSHNRGKNFFGYYLKKNNTWYHRKQKMKVINYKQCIITINSINEKSVYGFYIVCPYNFVKNKNIGDSINTKFDVFYDTDKLTNKTEFISYIGIITKKIDENYTIYLGGYEFKPFEKISDNN